MKKFNLMETEKFIKRCLKNRISINQKSIITLLMKGMLALSMLSLTTQVGYGYQAGGGSAPDNSSISIGNGSSATGRQSIAIGDRIQVSGSQATGLGNDISVTGYGAVAIGGDDAGVNGAGNGYNTAIDQEAYDLISKYYSDNGLGTYVGSNEYWTKTAATGTGSIALGVKAVGLKQGAVGIGVKALGLGLESTAIGAETLAFGNYATAIGKKSVAKGEGSLAIGNEANVKGEGSISLGKNIVDTASTISIGNGNKSSGEGTNNILLGNNLETSNSKVIILGSGSSGKVDGAVILGNEASVTVKGGVAIGNGSKSTTKTTDGYDFYNRTNTITALSDNGTVNVGKRTISGVSAATEDDQAVNLAQLKTVALHYKGNNGVEQKYKLSEGTFNILGDGDDIVTEGLQDTLKIKIKKADSVSKTDAKVLASNVAFAAIKNARTKVGVKGEVLEVEKVENDGIDANEYYIKINNDKLNEQLANDFVKKDLSNINETKLTEKITKGNLTSTSTIKVTDGEGKLISGNASLDIVEGSITKNHLHPEVNDKLNKIDTNETAINTIKENMGGNSEKLTAHENAINSNKDAINKQDKDIAANKVSIENNANAINALDKSVTENKGSIAANKANIDVNASKITDLGNNYFTFKDQSDNSFKRENSKNKTLTIKSGDIAEGFKENNLKTEIKAKDDSAELLIGLNENLTKIISVSGTNAKISFGENKITLEDLDGENISLTGLKNGAISSNSKDAVNGSQLNSVTKILGARVDDSGNIIDPSYSVAGTAYNTIPNVVKAIDESITTLSNKSLIIKANVNTKVDGFVRKNNEDKTLEIVSGDLTDTKFKANNLQTEVNSEGTKILIGLNNELSEITSITGANGSGKISFEAGKLNVNSAKITNLSKGTEAEDAVNISQLKDLVSKLGGNAEVKEDGTIKAPEYEIGGKTVNNLGEAINEIGNVTKSMSENTLFEYVDKDGTKLIKKDNLFFKLVNGKEVPVPTENVVIKAKDNKVVRNVASAITNGDIKTIKTTKDDKILSSVATIKDLQTISVAGMEFKGNDYTGVKNTHVRLGNTLTIKGEDTDNKEFNSAKGNILVASDGKDLTVKLSKDLINLKSTTFKDSDDKDNLKITADQIKFNTRTEVVDEEEEVYGTGKITGLADIDEDSDTGDYAVNKRYVDKKTKTIKNQIFAITSGAEGIVVYTNKKGDRIVKAKDDTTDGSFYLFDPSVVSSDLYLKYKTKDNKEIVKDKDGNYYELTDNKIDKNKKVNNVDPKSLKPKGEKIHPNNIQASIVDENGQTANPIVFNNVRRGDISKNSHNAINGSQLYKLGNDILGLEVEDAKGKDRNKLFKAPIFNKLKDSKGIEATDANNPKTIIAAINKLTDKANEGFSVAANIDDKNSNGEIVKKQYLGSQIDIVRASDVITTDEINYTGSNLITKITQDTTSKNSVIQIGLKEKPEFKEITVKDDTKPNNTAVISPDKTLLVETKKDGENDVTIKSTEYGVNKVDMLDKSTEGKTLKLTQEVRGTVITEKNKDGDIVKSSKYELDGATLTDKDENKNETTSTYSKLSDKKGNNVETTASGIKVEGSDKVSLEIAKDSIKSKNTKLEFNEDGKITLSYVNQNVTLDGIKDANITKDSKEAVNGSQIYAMQKNVLGYADGENGTLTVPTFDKLIDYKTKGETKDTAPTNFKAAVDNLLTTVNKGFKVYADANIGDNKTDNYNNQYLGSSISVKTGNLTKDKVNYSGSNLVTEYKSENGDGIITVSLKEKPEFKEITIKDVDKNNNTTTVLSPEKIKISQTDTVNGASKEVKTAEYGLQNKFVDNSVEGTEKVVKHNADGTNIQKTVDGKLTEANLTSDKLDFKVADGKGTGTITGLADITENSTGDTAVNKRYVDRIINEVDMNRPFEYFTKGDNPEKVIRGRDGKLYKEKDLKTAKFVNGKYEPELTVVENKDVELKAMPNGDAIELGHIASGINKEKIGISKISEDDAVTITKALNEVNDKVILGKVATVGDLQAISIAGLDFIGNDGNKVHRSLSSTLKLQGEGKLEGNTATNNIKVEKNKDSDGLDIKLASNITNIESITTIKKDNSQTTLNHESLSIDKNNNDGKSSNIKLTTDGTTLTKTEKGDSFDVVSNAEYKNSGSKVTKTITDKDKNEVTTKETNTKLGGIDFSEIVKDKDDAEKSKKSAEYSIDKSKLVNNTKDGENHNNQSLTQDLTGTLIEQEEKQGDKTTTIRAKYQKDGSELVNITKEGENSETKKVTQNLEGTLIVQKEIKDGKTTTITAKYQKDGSEITFEDDKSNKSLKQDLTGTIITNIDKDNKVDKATHYTLNETTMSLKDKNTGDSKSFIQNLDKSVLTNKTGDTEKTITKDTSGLNIVEKTNGSVSKEANYNINEASLNNGTNKSKLTADGLTFGKTKDENPEIKISASKLDDKGKVTEAPSISFSSEIKDGEKFGSGLITGLADITSESTGDTAVNKRYVDRIIDEVDKNRPFEYFTKGENPEKVVRGRDGKLYKKTELDKATYTKGGYVTEGKLEEVSNEDVVLNAMPVEKGEKPINIGHIASGIDSKKIGEGLLSNELAKDLILGNEDKNLKGLNNMDDKSTLSTVATVGDLQALSIAGITFKGNEEAKDKEIHKNLGETISIIGHVDKEKDGPKVTNPFESAANNIEVKSEDNNLVIQLSNQLENLKSARFKDNEGNTTYIKGNETTLTDKDNNTNLTTAKSVKLSDKDDNYVETTSKGITIKGNNSSLKIADNSISSRQNKLEFTEAGKITLSNTSKGVENTNVTLAGVKKGLITDNSNEAINGAQIKDLNDKLGLNINKDENGFETPIFEKLVNADKSLSEEKPNTIKGAINSLNAKVNEGFIVKADQNNETGQKDNFYNNQYLGSSINVITGNLESSGIKYSGSNLVTEYRNVDGNGNITISLKEKPEFKQTIIKDTGNASLTLNPNELVLEGGENEKVVLSNSGLNLGKNKITNVGEGTDDADAVNFKQLKTSQASLASGIASAMAMANLTQVDYRGEYKNQISAAFGSYKNEYAVGVGLSGIGPKGKLMYKVSGSYNSKGDLGVGAGLGYQFNKDKGRESTLEKVLDRLVNVEKENKELKSNMEKIVKEISSPSEKMYIIDLYDENVFELKETQMIKLKAIVNEINEKYSNKIIDIIGYADINADNRYNLALGLKRANVINEQLIKLGLKNPQNIRKVSSYGFNNKINGGLSNNRRVEIIVK